MYQIAARPHPEARAAAGSWRLSLCVMVLAAVSCASPPPRSPVPEKPETARNQPAVPTVAEQTRDDDLASLVALVNSDDIRVKMEAASALVSLGTPRAVSALFDAYDSSTVPRFRAHVLNTAAAGDIKAFRDRASQAVTDPEEQVRTAACHALLMLAGEDAVRELLAILERTKDPGIMTTIIPALAGSGAEMAVPVLVDLVSSDEAEVAKAALAALERLTGRDFGSDAFQWMQWWSANSHLSRVEWLESANADLRKQIADLQERYQEYIVEVLTWSADETRPAALVRVLAMGLPVVTMHAFDELSGITNTSGLSEEVAGEALTRSLEILTVSRIAVLRAAAARFLGVLGRREAAQPLEAALNDADASVRVAVADALGALGSPSSVQPLTSLIARAEKAKVLSAAVLALGKLKASGSADAIMPLLNSNDASLRESAARALGAIRADTAIGPLMGLVADDPEPRVRWFAADALGEIGDKRASRVLSKALSDANAGVRHAAARALGLIADPEALDALAGALTDTDASVATAAWEALLRMAGQDAQVLCEIARRALDAGLTGQAAQAFERAGPAVGELPEGDRRRCAEVYEAVGRWPAAAEVLASLVGANPDDVELNRRHLAALINAGHLDEAGKAVADLAKRFPDNEPHWWQAQLTIARKLVDSTRWEEAHRYIGSLGSADRKPPPKIADALSQLAEQVTENLPETGDPSSREPYP